MSKTKSQQLEDVTKEIERLQDLMDADATHNTPENEVKFKSLLEQGEKLIASIKNTERLTGMKSFLNEPAGTPIIAGGDGASQERFVGKKTLGASFVESEIYKKKTEAKSQSAVTFEFKGVYKPGQAKATFDTATAGPVAGVQYLNDMVLLEQQKLTVADLFAQGQTTLNAVPYMREVSFVNAAAPVAEGALKPEATFDLEAVSAPVKKIAVRARVTDELFADFPAMRSYIDNRMVFMVEQREELQLLSGSGIGANIEGVMTVAGTQSQAKATDTVPDAIFKAITKIRNVGFLEPDAIVINPTDWQNLRLLKDANNQYYGGGPFTGAYGNALNMQDSFWGLRVIVTTAMTAGTALVGAFKLGGQVFYREGVRVESTNTNADDWEKNLISIRVEERLALAIYRPLAFCKVTGI